MKKTRLLLLVGVLLLSLALVGMALAADTTQKPNPPDQVAFTGLPPTGGGVNSLSGSNVTFDASVGGETCYIPGTPQTFCFKAESYSTGWEYTYSLWQKFPTDWTVNDAYIVGTPYCDNGSTFGTFAWSFETSPYEVEISHMRFNVSTGDHCVAYYCFDVVPGSPVPSALESWYWDGDNYGDPPHQPCSDDVYTPASMSDQPCDEAINPQAVVPVCNLEPGLYLNPPSTEAAGCNGIPQVHDLSLYNNTGSDGTFDMTYTAPPGMAELTGPATVSALYGETVPFEVTLTPNVCNFDPIVATIDAEGNGYDDTATITKEIVNVPSWETVPASAPSWAGTGYPRDGCTAMNADGDWVSYQIGDMSSYTGFWGYNMTTNTWSLVGATGTPADRWAPDWAYDPDTNLCYMTGGANVAGGGTYAETYMFDPVANAFTQLGNFTSIRDFHNSWVGTIDGTKYLCIGGGVNASSILVQATQCFDLSQSAPGVWNAENAQIAAFPTDPFGAADGILHAATGDQFWYVGGAIQNFATVTDEARYWDDADNAWHFAGNTGYPRYRVEGDFYDGAFYQVGGSSGGFTPTSEAVRGTFDGSTWTWALMANLANIRMDNVVGVTDSSVWSIDGYGATGSAYVERLAFCPLCTGPLQAEKTATPFILPGDAIDYSVAIANTSDADVAATMIDPIPEGTTFVPGSLSCDTGTCSFDAGLNAILWEGEIGPALKGGNVESLTGSFVTFDPTLGGTTCNAPETAQTFCFRAESFSPDYEYVYNTWLKFPTDWTVSNAYVVGTPVCDNGTWGTFGWSFETSPYEINIAHARYQGSGGAHCIATYCVDVTTGDPTGSAASWYWDGDGYANPPHNPCSADQYTPASMSGQPCDEWVNPVADVPLCPTNIATIDFQVAADGVSCPSVVTNVATISSEGNPDVIATADTNIYCSLDPDIVVTPLALVADQAPDEVTTQQLQICNEGPTPLDWSLTEVPILKTDWVSPALSSTRPFAINQLANVSRDPSVSYTPIKPTSEILLDQAPNQVNGVFVDSACELCTFGVQSVADNFALEATASLEQIVFWTGYYPSDIPIDPDLIRVLIHQDAAGLPGTVVYDESNVSYTRSQTGVVLFGVHEWIHTLTLATPVSLPAGNYWVEIYNTTGIGDNTNFFWETGNVDTTGRGLFDSAYAFETPGVTWIFPGDAEMALQLIGTIEPVADIPWLSEDPTSGTVDGFACVFTDVSFDSAALAPGTYTGVLDVNSNDPDEPVVPVDVTLNVLAAPDITVDPLFLESTLLPNQQETQDLNVCNDGEVPLDWSLTEVPGLKVNSVTTVPAAKPSRQITLSLDANNISGPTAPAPVVPNADVTLVLDDGSRDNDIGIGGTLEFLWVNRFTPAPDEFPFQLNQIQIYFSSVGLVNVGDNIILVVYENTSGNNDPAVGSNFLASFPTTVQALDTWNVYDLATPVTFNGPGDAIIGAIGLEVPGTSYWPASIDQTTTQARSWAGWWTSSPPPTPPLLPPDSSWTLIDAYFPGNWMVRGYGTTGGDAIPWLSETPTEGSVVPGDCVVINVTFDSTDLAVGVYEGSLDIASNDPDEPVVNVPVTLTVVAPDILVTPTSLELTLFPDEIGTLPFTIENIGNAVLNWTATDGATWLSEAPASGAIDPADSTEVVATFDSAGLAPAVYETNIVIASDDPDTPEVLLPVTLTVIERVSDLSVVKTASAEVVKVGEMITYTLEVSNAGPQDALGVTLVDTLPTLVTFVSASAGCTEEVGVVTCDIGDLAMEDSVTLTIVVTAAVDGIAVNTAEVSSENADPDLANNTSSVETMINPAIYKFYLPIIQKG